MNRARRGQSLVLWALSLLLLTVMVVLNLSITSRIRDRMRLQELADASAYDQAVLTARYFNALAVINRARAADGVALASHQAVVSYASVMRSAVANVRGGLQTIGGSFRACCNDRFCPQRSCACGEANEIARTLDGIDRFADLTYGQVLWNNLDLAAAREFYEMYTHARELDETQTRLSDAFRGSNGLIETTTDRVLQVADVQEWSNGVVRSGFSGTPTTSRLTPAERSFTVVGGSRYPPPLGDAYSVPPILGAVMAGRPNTFVTTRFDKEANVRGLVSAALGPAAGSVSWRVLELRGTTGFGRQLETAGTYGGIRNGDAMSHEHGRVPAWSWKNGTACRGPGQPSSTAPASSIEAHLITSVGASAASSTGEHRYENISEPTAPIVHAIGARTGVAMFGPTNELDPELVAQDAWLFGQPLLLSLVVRDLGRAPRQPWDVSFDFGGRGAQFDTAKKRAPQQRQLAMAGGLAYYHRAARLFRAPPPPPPAPQPPAGLFAYGEMSSWKEPANLWNPFWRASLFLAGQGPRTVVQRRLRSQARDDRAYWLEQYGFGVESDVAERLWVKGYRGSR